MLFRSILCGHAETRVSSYTIPRQHGEQDAYACYTHAATTLSNTLFQSAIFLAVSDTGLPGSFEHKGLVISTDDEDGYNASFRSATFVLFL